MNKLPVFFAKRKKWVHAFTTWPETRAVENWKPMPDWAKENPKNNPEWWTGRWEVRRNGSVLTSGTYSWNEARARIAMLVNSGHKVVVTDIKSGKQTQVDNETFQLLTQEWLEDPNAV